MKRSFFIIVVCLVLIPAQGFSSEQKLPVVDGQTVVATVNDIPITLEEFNRAIARSHAKRSEKEKAGRIDFSYIMNRLINSRLILLEAGNMGLYELPEIKNMVDTYSKQTLITLLLEEQVKDIRPNKDEVETIYKRSVTEWNIRSVFFARQEDAKKVEEEIRTGNNFNEILTKAVAEGLATGVDEGFLKDEDLTPSIAEHVHNMEIGSISPIVSLGKKRFVIFKLEGVRFPEDEDLEALQRAEQQALKRKRAQASKDYYHDLRKRYVRVDKELLAALDYEAEEPGFEKLLKDTRVIAEISGEKPITVGELSEALEKKFYHGVETAIRSKSINNEKWSIMANIVEKRVLVKEALNQNFDKKESYKETVKEYENAAVFDLFIKKVVVPDIRLDRKELERYYKKNVDQYTYPEMMRIKSLVFAARSDAENALEQLTKGTDFNWLSSKAEGQVDKETEGLLNFEGKLLTLRSLPEGVRQALSEAKPGDFRLYASPEGYYYVLYVYHLVPAQLLPFANVREKIAKKVFKDKVKKAIEDYADKLREYYPVKIYAKDLQ